MWLTGPFLEVCCGLNADQVCQLLRMFDYDHVALRILAVMASDKG